MTLVALLASCSGPDADNNDTPIADMGDEVVDEPDMADDAGGEDEPDATPDLGPEIYPVLEEMEPNTEPDEAMPFTQPAILTGSVSATDDVFDWWEVDLAGPAILRVTINGGDIGWVEVRTPLADKRGVYGGPGATREFFVPKANRYQIGVHATTDNPDVEYRVQVESYEVTPIPLTELTTTGDLDDGNVDVYSWTSTGSGFTVMEVMGQRAPISSGIDSFLFVYDDTLNSFEWNDDAMSGGTKDSRLDFDRRDGAEYLIAVDMYEPTEDRRYELRIQAN